MHFCKKIFRNEFISVHIHSIAKKSALSTINSLDWQRQDQPLQYPLLFILVGRNSPMKVSMRIDNIRVEISVRIKYLGLIIGRNMSLNGHTGASIMKGRSPRRVGGCWAPFPFPAVILQSGRSIWDWDITALGWREYKGKRQLKYLIASGCIKYTNTPSGKRKEAMSRVHTAMLRRKKGVKQ